MSTVFCNAIDDVEYENSEKLCSEDFLTMIFTTPIQFHVHVSHTNLCLVVDRLRVSLHKHPQSRLLASLKLLKGRLHYKGGCGCGCVDHT